MALTYPLNLGQFYDDLNIQNSVFSLSESRQFNVNGAGQILDASLGARLWKGEATLVPAKHQELAKFLSLIELLLEPGASFVCYDKRHTWPFADPTGSILGASTPTLGTVDANNVDIRISGLPNGYTLTKGDMIAFTYLSGPTRRALHRVVVGATAGGLGNADIQVVPPIRSGYTLGTAITLNKPLMKAKIVPGSYKPPSGSPGALSSGASFEFMQTLR